MKIVIRIIALPFFAALGLIAVLRMWVSYCVSFVRFGGEALIYKKDHTVADILNLLEKMNSEQKVKTD